MELRSEQDIAVSIKNQQRVRELVFCEKILGKNLVCSSEKGKEKWSSHLNCCRRKFRGKHKISEQFFNAKHCRGGIL